MTPPAIRNDRDHGTSLRISRTDTMEATLTDPGMNTTRLTALLELSEAEAARDMIVAAMEADDIQTHGLATMPLGSGVALVAPELDVIALNRVVGLGIAEDATVEMIESIRDLYHGAGVRRYAIQIAPGARPSGIDEWVTSRGALLKGGWCKLCRTLDREIPSALETDLTVTEISREHAAIFGSVVCAGFGFPERMRPVVAATIGRPGWRHYMAWDGALPVAAGALHIHDGIAWLGLGCTLPTQRGRGAQSAIIRRRLEDARRMGCRLAVTETAEGTDGRPAPSCRNLLRAGFEIVYTRPNYLFTRKPV